MTKTRTKTREFGQILEGILKRGESLHEFDKERLWEDR
jgi:hypothetical protein